MNTKTLGLFAFGIFALIFVMSAVSADIVFTNVTGNGANVMQGNTAKVSFQLFENTTGGSAASAITFNTPITMTSGTNTFNSSATVTGAITTLAQDATSTVMSLSFVVPSNQSTGTYTGTLQPSGTYTALFSPLTVTLTVTAAPTMPSEITSCTAIGNSGNLEVKKIDFTNKGSQYKEFGEDDEWFLLDEIEVQVEIANDGDYDISDVEISWGLWDTNANQWVVDFNDEDTFNIDEGDEETLTVSFTLDDELDVDLDELNDGDNYKLYVVASGTIDNNDAGTLDGTDTCVGDFESASIIIESDFVVLNNFQIPETLTCGSNVEISADVWNIGDSDQDEVSVQVTSTDFALNENIPVGDLDAFDSQKISLNLKVPNNMSEKSYVIKFEVLDEDGDVYQNDYDDDYSEFSVPVTVKGGCTTEPVTAPVTVTASLTSGGKAGQDLVVKATLTNPGTASASYLIASSGHGQWASTYEVVPSTLTLAAGQTGDATFTFNVNKDAFGEQTFYIEIVSGSQVTRQPVSVVIEKSGLFSSITGGAISENAWVWGLGALNILLILIIIIVAFRVMRK